MSAVERGIADMRGAILTSFILCLLTVTVSAISAESGKLTTANSDVTLRCYKNHSNDVINWTRNGVELTNSSGKYDIRVDDIASNLTVHKVGEGDVGIYKCTNQSNVDIVVNLYSVPFVDANLKTSATVTEGDDAELVCSGWGWPTPTVTWIRLDPEHVYGTSDDDVGFSKVVTGYNVTLERAILVLEKTHYPDDQRDYVCMLTNEPGVSANATVHLRVKDRLAAVWPTIGIIIEVIVLIVFIVVFEIKRRKDEAAEEGDKNK